MHPNLRTHMSNISSLVGFKHLSDRLQGNDNVSGVSTSPFTKFTSCRFQGNVVCCRKNNNFPMILLMEESLHQLIGSLSHYLHDFIHPMWYLQVQNTDFFLFQIRHFSCHHLIHEKKCLLLSMKCWLFSKDPYFMIYDIILSYNCMASISSPIYP